jgi:tetratricopeptide (TPR) repeat protein
VRGLCVLLCLVLPWGGARAESPDGTARARTHFEAGRALYILGNYSDAIREFAAGYQLAPRPQFLINLGQSHRKLGDLPKARDMYRKFLSEAPPDDPDRAAAKQVLDDVEREIAARPAAPLPPPVPAVPVVAPAPAPATTASVSAEPRRRPFIARHWWIIPTSAVVAAGLAVGIYFAVRPAGCPASIDCIDLMGSR